MPTPVSALIHAATMVTAGVYLLIRSSPLTEYSSTVLVSCLCIGAITTIISSIIGLFQQDIKRVIAYSTMSQLGMMFVAIGLSAHNIALFHLINHAFYKALLFLAAGSVIHAVSDSQDFRKYGGLKELLPLTYSVMLIGSLSLVAFPFMTGFYSKDFILESAYAQFTYSSYVVYYITTTGAMFTTLYSIKILYLTFLTNPNGSLHSYRNVHESNIFMSIPLFILAIFSVFFGYICRDLYIGLGSSFFLDNAIFVHPLHEIMVTTEFGVDILYKLLPLVLTVFISIFALLMFEYFSNLLILFKLSRLMYNIFSLFSLRLLFEYFYNKYIVNFILKSGGQTTKILDKGSVELLGPFGLERILTNLSKNLNKLDTGVVTSYALYILIGFSLYLLLPLLHYINILLILVVMNLFLSYLENNLFNYNVNNTTTSTSTSTSTSLKKRLNVNTVTKRSFSSNSRGNHNPNQDNTNTDEENNRDNTNQDQTSNQNNNPNQNNSGLVRVGVPPYGENDYEYVDPNDPNISEITPEDFSSLRALMEQQIPVQLENARRQYRAMKEQEERENTESNNTSGNSTESNNTESNNKGNSTESNNTGSNNKGNSTESNNTESNNTQGNNASSSNQGSGANQQTPLDYVVELEQTEMPSPFDPEE